MTMEIKKMGAETIIDLSGRLDTSTAPVLEKTINEQIPADTNLVLDLGVCGT